jgi:uracil-DNA glycosylase family 4
VHAVGPLQAPILLIGEAAGRTEVLTKDPFSGEAGWELDRLLKIPKIDRATVRIGNVLLCHPPNDWLVKSPWEQEALLHCRPQLDSLLAEGHKVVVPLGGTALRAVMGLPRTKDKDGIRVEDFHGAPVWDNRGFWICPTFHPAWNSRNDRKYTQAMAFDLATAKELAEGKWQLDEPELVVDPPVGWFEQWATAYMAKRHECVLYADVETPDKTRKSDESKLSKEDKSFEILFWNFAVHRGQGITVPNVGPYKTIVKRILEAGGHLGFWHAPYDVPRAKKAGIRIEWERVWDAMDAFHLCYSGLPKGLGFAAPFFSRRGPWKHLGNLNGTYRALDGVQTCRAFEGTAEILRKENRWHVFERHCHNFDAYALRPAGEVGMGMSRQGLQEFTDHMGRVCTELQTTLTQMVPDKVLKREGPYVTEVVAHEGEIVECREERAQIKTCLACGTDRVPAKHRCTDRAQVPHVVVEARLVPRFYRKQPFNPASWQQVLAYIKAKGHKPGVNRKTKKDTTDKKTLNRLKLTGDQFYFQLDDHRKAHKMKGTYGNGMLERLDEFDRVHTTFGHGPWSGRLSSYDPNLQTIATHSEQNKWAPQFRRAVRALPGCRFISADYSGIEAVNVGYWSGDPNYIRGAKLGMHAYVESHLLHELKLLQEPASWAWPDDDLRRHFAEIKAQFKDKYESSKRTVHGYNYGLTAYGLRETFPDLFKTRKEAERLISIYEACCPKLKPWQVSMRNLAHAQRFLLNHFDYKAWFFSVVAYKKRGRGPTAGWEETLGKDAKKVVAFPPQSDAAGTIAEAALALFTPGAPNYIGDAGPTLRAADGSATNHPLRAIIHDDLTLEVRDSEVERVRHALVYEMTRGIEEMPLPAEWGLGEFLTVGVAVKEGLNWAPVDKDLKWSSDGNPDGMHGIDDIAGDVWVEDDEDEEEEDDEDAA